jgi:uncharacterized repeat protein (TIGR03803 family)
MRLRAISGLLTLLCCAAGAGCARESAVSLPLAGGPDAALRAPLRGKSSRPSATFASLYSFKGGQDGTDPFGDLININGTLYGVTTQGGGSANAGTVFKITRSGSESVVYSFDGNSGINPMGLTSLNGALYGTTYAGGASNYGTVFKIARGGTESLLYSLKGGSDGQYPYASLTAVNGALYGTTELGGSRGDGTVFKITPSGIESVIYSLSGYKDGITPAAPVIAVGGELYGTTYFGDLGQNGIVFKVTTSGGETILHRFKGGIDGARSTAGLVYVDGAFYGTTTVGGSTGNGTVFKVIPPLAERVLYSFQGGQDGANPYGGTLVYRNGALYGATAYGGIGVGYGTIFKVTTSGVETVLYRFKGGADGANPEGGLLEVNGTLYGTTYAGGSSQDGTVFSIAL